MKAEGSRRTAVSSHGDRNPSFAIRRIGKTGPNVFLRQIGKLLQDLLMGHSCGKIIQHVVDGHAQATDARFSGALSSFDSNYLPVIHTWQSSRTNRRGKRPFIFLFSRRSQCEPDPLNCVTQTFLPRITRMTRIKSHQIPLCVLCALCVKNSGDRIFQHRVHRGRRGENLKPET